MLWAKADPGARTFLSATTEALSPSPNSWIYEIQGVKVRCQRPSQGLIRGRLVAQLELLQMGFRGTGLAILPQQA
jgi:hypothetical protein